MGNDAMNSSAVIAAYEPKTETRGARLWGAATNVMRSQSIWIRTGVMMILTLLIGWLEYITGFQVAMANAVKHSRAMEIHLTMKLKDEMMEMRVEDNCIGLVNTSRTRSDGMGLGTMRCRAQALQSVLAIE